MVGFSAPATPLPSLVAEKNTAEFLLAVVLVVALAEETIFRGCLILRFKAITANTAVAILATAVIFSLAHGCERSGRVIAVGLWAWSLHSYFYMGRQSPVAPMVMHFLQDCIGIDSFAADRDEVKLQVKFWANGKIFGHIGHEARTVKRLLVTLKIKTRMTKRASSPLPYLPGSGVSGLGEKESFRTWKKSQPSVTLTRLIQSLP